MQAVQAQCLFRSYSNVRSSINSSPCKVYSPDAVTMLEIIQAHKQSLSNQVPIYSWVERVHSRVKCFPQWQIENSAPHGARPAIYLWWGQAGFFPLNVPPRREASRNLAQLQNTESELAEGYITTKDYMDSALVSRYPKGGRATVVNYNATGCHQNKVLAICCGATVLPQSIHASLSKDPAGAIGVRGHGVRWWMLLDKTMKFSAALVMFHKTKMTHLGRGWNC